MKGQVRSRLFPDAFPAAPAVPSTYRHPAVRAYREICHYKPNQIQRELIVNKVGDEARAVSLYIEVLTAFMAEGRPPQRVDWTLERFVEASPNVVGKSLSTDSDIVEEPDWPAAAIENDTWALMLSFVATKLSAESYSRWFAPIACKGIDPDRREIDLRVPHASIKNWVRTNYCTLLDDSLADAGLSHYQIVWTIEEGGAV